MQPFEISGIITSYIISIVGVVWILKQVMIGLWWLFEKFTAYERAVIKYEMTKQIENIEPEKKIE